MTSDWGIPVKSPEKNVTVEDRTPEGLDFKQTAEIFRSLAPTPSEPSQKKKETVQINLQNDIKSGIYPYCNS